MKLIRRKIARSRQHLDLRISVSLNSIFIIYMKFVEYMNINIFFFNCIKLSGKTTGRGTSFPCVSESCLNYFNAINWHKHIAHVQRNEYLIIVRIWYRAYTPCLLIMCYFYTHLHNQNQKLLYSCIRFVPFFSFSFFVFFSLFLSFTSFMTKSVFIASLPINYNT